MPPLDLSVFWDYLRDPVTIQFIKGFGSALAGGAIAIWKKDAVYRGLAAISKNGPRHLTNGKWFTAFVQNRRMQEEEVECKRVIFTNYYLGVVKYKAAGGRWREYPFSGRLADGLFIATYRSEEEGEGDCGSWTLKFNLGGTALIGGYSWQVKDEIGYDFYQWTREETSQLITARKSDIDGTGLFPTMKLPRGCLIGEFIGSVLESPTRESLFIDGEHIQPNSDCKFRQLNHSCEPTAEVRGRLVFLIKAVDPDDPDDEITIDYTKTETTIAASFNCRCPRCRRSMARRIGS